LGRSLRHLITLLEELHALGIAFVSLNEGIDATPPAGKLQVHILGAIAEFERERIRERVLAGLHGIDCGSYARPLGGFRLGPYEALAAPRSSTCTSDDGRARRCLPGTSDPSAMGALSALLHRGS
jgi:hypothetical protein